MPHLPNSTTHRRAGASIQTGRANRARALLQRASLRYPNGASGDTGGSAHVGRPENLSSRRAVSSRARSRFSPVRLSLHKYPLQKRPPFERGGSGLLEERKYQTQSRKAPSTTGNPFISEKASTLASPRHVASGSRSDRPFAIVAAIPRRPSPARCRSSAREPREAGRSAGPEDGPTPRRQRPQRKGFRSYDSQRMRAARPLPRSGTEIRKEGRVTGRHRQRHRPDVSRKGPGFSKNSPGG